MRAASNIEFLPSPTDPLRQWLASQSDNETESPIEAMLVTALDMLRAYQSFHGSVPAVYTQHPAGSYFLDVMVEGQTYRGAVFRLAIECDGHEFHERTPAQAEHDRKRDRWLQAHGFEVMRFTGREINRNPFDCAQQVYDRYNAIAELGSWRAA